MGGPSLTQTWAYVCLEEGAFFKLFLRGGALLNDVIRFVFLSLFSLWLQKWLNKGSGGGGKWRRCKQRRHGGTLGRQLEWRQVNGCEEPRTFVACMNHLDLIASCELVR